jgi:isocitrate dehydrogenase kinase/phosphatase
LYVREEHRPALRAIIDYGQAIKDLARNNIFPGDLLFKNFGLTRTAARSSTTTTSCAWSPTAASASCPTTTRRRRPGHVLRRPHDVFPEQFPRFLGVEPDSATR